MRPTSEHPALARVRPRMWFGRLTRPENAIIGVCGDCDRDASATLRRWEQDADLAVLIARYQATMPPPLAFYRVRRLPAPVRT